MKDEIEAAAQFLTQLVSQNQPANITEAQLKEFRNHLVRLFQERYHDHWFPERPQRGQAFRCIRLNSVSRPDPLIQKAAVDTGLLYGDLKLPVEFTLWVDPKEVSCRFGEHEGSYCTVASFENGGTGGSNGSDNNNALKANNNPNSTITSSFSTSSPSSAKANAMAPLQVTIATDHHDKTLAQTQQRSPNRINRSKLSPTTTLTLASLSPPPNRSVQQYRVGCFYPNYEPQKSWYAYSSLSPPLALNTHSYHTSAKSRSSPYSAATAAATGWGLAYVPTTVRYLTNSWPAMSTMVKV